MDDFITPRNVAHDRLVLSHRRHGSPPVERTLLVLHSRRVSQYVSDETLERRCYLLETILGVEPDPNTDGETTGVK